METPNIFKDWGNLLARHHLQAVGWQRENLEVVVLVINGGDGFTRQALARFRGADPVDTYTRHLTRRLILPGVRRFAQLRRWAWAMVDQGGGLEQEDFSALAREGGLGGLGRLGLLMHPLFGPWWAMRLAMWLRLGAAEGAAFCQQFPRPAPYAPYESVCVGCDAPCVQACPGEADGGRDLLACLTHVRGGGCADVCGARSACVAGRSWVYGEEAHRHHHGAFRRSISSSG